MEKEQQQILESEVKLILEDILAKAEWQGEECFWKTMTMDDMKTILVENESIYGGTAGIALTLIKAYTTIPDERFTKHVKGAAQYLLRKVKEEKTSYFAFLTGRSGVALALYKMGEFLKDENLKKEAVSLAKGAQSFIDDDFAIDDVINGAAGILVAMMHFHALTKDAAFIKLSNDFADLLLNRATINGTGLYWDRNEKQISGLCGFSHGAAGAGWAFAEASRYFNNPNLMLLTKLAFSYESDRFVPEWHNWPDLRKGIFNERERLEHSKAYLEDNLDFYRMPSNMNAWCHGAAGIGLARLRVFEITGEKQYWNDFEEAAKKCMQDDANLSLDELSSYTLCHGVFGNAHLYLEAYRISKDPKWLRHAEQLALDSIPYREKVGLYFSGFSLNKHDEELSLFMGNSGIAWFLLSLMDEDYFSYQIPYVEAKPTQLATELDCLSLKQSDIYRRLFEKYFPKTLERLPDFSPSLKLGEPLFTSFINQIKALKISPETKALLELESAKVEIEQQATSLSFEYIKTVLNIEHARGIIERKSVEELLELELYLNPNCKLLKSEVNLDEKADSPEEDEYYYLLRFNITGVAHDSLSDFSFEVLNSFEKPLKVRDAVDQILDLFDDMTDEEADHVKEMVLEQARRALASVVLLDVDHKEKLKTKFNFSEN